MATALDPDLTCPICLELFKDPVTLPCMHSYCRSCLTSILQSNVGDHDPVTCSTDLKALDGDHSGRVVQCPECRYITVLDEGGIQKLPRNFTLANIVAKYTSKVKEEVTVPCDICDESPSAAVKTCVQCRMSYCVHCLFFHPKKGALAKHNLVDPKEIKHTTEREMFCLRCKSCLTESKDGKYGSHHNHSEDVVDIYTAKKKIIEELESKFGDLEGKKKKVMDEVSKGEEALRDLQTESRAVKEKFATDVEKMVKDLEQKGEKQIQNLQSSLMRLSEIILDVKKIGKTDVMDLDIKDMSDISNKVVEELKNGEVVAFELEPLNFAFESKESTVIEKTSSPGDCKEQRSSTVQPVSSQSAEVNTEGQDRVVVISCTQNPRTSNQGASVTVKWFYPKPGVTFMVKFTRSLGGRRMQTVMNSGVTECQLTEECLTHGTEYIVTVSVVNCPGTESEGSKFSTLRPVNCKEFSFSPEVKSYDIQIHWQGKIAARDDIPWEHNNSIDNIEGTVAGTLCLQNSPCYWEAEVSYHLRGVSKSSYVVCVGICAEQKLSVIDNVAHNYFFYGVAFGKNDNGTPVRKFFSAGYCLKDEIVKGEHHYRVRIGFFYDPIDPSLSIVDISKNEKVFVSEPLKSIYDSNSFYFPVCFIPGDKVDVRLISGSEISEIPSCLRSVLK